jgi:hypothetical protein
MFIFKDELLELTLNNHYFTKLDDFDNNNFRFIKGRFLIVQIPKEQNLCSADLKSENLIIVETKKSPIGDLIYDADDRIKFNIKTIIKKGFITYIICIPKTSSIKELDLKTDRYFGFDFTIKKLKRDFYCFNTNNNKIQKKNIISRFLYRFCSFFKNTFYYIYNRIFITKKISFRMKNKPVILMELKYKSDNHLSILFPKKEL